MRTGREARWDVSLRREPGRTIPAALRGTGGLAPRLYHFGSMRPLVSVIVPAYNAEAHLSEAIDSALAQTYPRVEVVVVDDGSTDRTRTVMAAYGDRIRAVHQENAGPAAARNAGICASRGELLGFLDADDVWLPERLDRLVSVLEATPELGMVTSDAYLLEDSTPTDVRYYARKRRAFPWGLADQQAEIAIRNFLFVGVVARRALVDRVGGFFVGPRRGEPGGTDGAEDYDLWTRLLLAGAPAALVDEPLGYYRVQSASLSRSPAQGVAHQAILQRHLPDLWRLGAKGRARDLYEIGSRLAASGRRREAAHYFWRTLRAEGAQTSRLRYAGSGVWRLLSPSPSQSRMDRNIAAGHRAP